MKNKNPRTNLKIDPGMPWFNPQIPNNSLWSTETAGDDFSDYLSLFQSWKDRKIKKSSGTTGQCLPAVPIFRQVF